MIKNVLTVLFLFGVFLTQACGKTKAPSPEESCHFQQNSYRQRVSWAKLPVVLKAHSSLSPDQVQALREAIDIWNTARAKEWGVTQNFFELSAGVYSGAPFIEDRLSVVSINSPWTTGDEREQAETVLRWDGVYISEADMHLNGSKPFDLITPIEDDHIDLVALYVHELGHVLGLLHIEATEYTTMSFELERGTDKRRQIGKLELDALRCEY
jgi:hypothetical protein